MQFSLLHSKFHLCSVATRALLLSTYIKFINLFPETKATIQGVLRAGSQLRNADVELQQRAVEYLTLSSVASTDVLVRAQSPCALPLRLAPRSSPRPALMPIPDRTLQATVLEEMPPFPERESSILAKLKRKKGPGAGSALDDSRRDPSSHDINGGVEPTPSTVVSPGGLGWGRGRLGPARPAPSHLPPRCPQSTPSPSADLLGLRAAPPPAAPPAPSGAGNLLVDVFSDSPATQPGLGPSPEEAFLRYWPWAHLPPTPSPLSLSLVSALAAACPGLPPPSLWASLGSR